MGISIEQDPPCIDFPYPIRVTLECDDRAEMFCRGFTAYMHEDGLVGCRTAAIADGWLERSTSDGPKWLCPACSGKR